MYNTILSDIGTTLPLIVVILAGLIVIVIDCFWNDHVSLPWIGGLGVSLAIVLELQGLGNTGTVWYDLLIHGGFASFVNIILLICTLMTIALSVQYLSRMNYNYGEVYALVLFATAGMMLMASANSLITIFVGLETMSICLYVLTGLVREDKAATESALKYFLLGAFATGFFLYGMALLYGATGTMYLHEMGASLAESGRTPLFWIGVGLLLIGFLFKIGAVPFHMWTPDVYQGAPTTLTGYMATASKAAAFAALLLVLFSALPSGFEKWGLLIAIISAVTMVLGNLLALSQANVKRMLAYSSIAHAGYLLVGIAAGTGAGYSGTLYYLLVYALMNIGAFGVMAVLEWDGKSGRVQTLESLSGVGVKRPFLGIVMAFFMFSLAGFPPLAGFVAKVKVFAPAIDAGLLWLVIIGAVSSVLSAYYYLRVLYYFWFASPEDPIIPNGMRAFNPRLGIAALVVLGVCAAAQLGLFVFPGGILELAESFFATGNVALIP